MWGSTRRGPPGSTSGITTASTRRSSTQPGAADSLTVLDSNHRRLKAQPPRGAAPASAAPGRRARFHINLRISPVEHSYTGLISSALGPKTKGGDVGARALGLASGKGGLRRALGRAGVRHGGSD